MLGRLAQIVIVSTALVGCAAQQGTTPFHVYQSPLLAAETETPRSADRSFDPTRPGDWPETSPERVVAESSDATWDERKRKKGKQEPSARPKPRRENAKGTLPNLSSRRAVGGRGAGASSSAEKRDLDPSLAAAYIHKTLSVNGVSFPDEARTSIPALWKACKAHGKTHQADPLPGDAVFFHNAFDANGDGRNNDWYTHVGIVESIDDGGTVAALTWQGGAVRKIKVTPQHPDQTEIRGKVVNSQIRQPTADDPPFTQYYAGQLFAGWCSVLDQKRDVVVIDSWRP